VLRAFFPVTTADGVASLEFVAYALLPPRLDADAARAISLHSRSGRTRRAVCGTRAFSPEWRAADCALFLHYRLFEAGPLFFADDIRGYGLHLRALLAARAVASLPVRLHRPLRQVAADGGGKRADFK
jgi:hypothetical protein